MSKLTLLLVCCTLIAITIGADVCTKDSDCGAGQCCGTTFNGGQECGAIREKGEVCNDGNRGSAYPQCANLDGRCKPGLRCLPRDINEHQGVYPYKCG